MEKEEQAKSEKVKILDFSTIMMIICLACIFSLTILNKIGILTNWILYVLLGLFLVLMVFFLMTSIRKGKSKPSEHDL